MFRWKDGVIVCGGGEAAAIFVILFFLVCEGNCSNDRGISGNLI